MSRSLQPSRLNMAFAQEGVALAEITPLQNMEPLAEETQGLQADSTVQVAGAAASCARAPAPMTMWLHCRPELPFR